MSPLESLHIYSWVPTTRWAWGQSDLELVLVPSCPPKIKAGHTDHKVAKLGVGEREPRERVLLGETGGGGVEGASAQAGTLGVPGPRLCPKHEPLACVTRTMTRAPGRSCPGGRLGCQEHPGLPATAVLPLPRGPAARARPFGGRPRRKTTQQRGLQSSRELPGPEWLPPAP